MEYIIKAEEKEKVMIEIWKKIDKTFFPQTTEKQKKSLPNSDY